jgi:hypothetical protein
MALSKMRPANAADEDNEAAGPKAVLVTVLDDTLG